MTDAVPELSSTLVAGVNWKPAGKVITRELSAVVFDSLLRFWMVIGARVPPAGPILASLLDTLTSMSLASGTTSVAITAEPLPMPVSPSDTFSLTSPFALLKSTFRVTTTMVSATLLAGTGVLILRLKKLSPPVRAVPDVVTKVKSGLLLLVVPCATVATAEPATEASLALLS